MLRHQALNLRSDWAQQAPDGNCRRCPGPFIAWPGSAAAPSQCLDSSTSNAALFGTILDLLRLLDCRWPRTAVPHSIPSGAFLLSGPRAPLQFDDQPRTICPPLIPCLEKGPRWLVREGPATGVYYCPARTPRRPPNTLTASLPAAHYLGCTRRALECNWPRMVVSPSDQPCGASFIACPRSPLATRWRV